MRNKLTRPLFAFVALSIILGSLGAAILLTLTRLAPARAASVTITEYPVPTSSGAPDNITSGPDGNLWFTENVGNNIGRVNLNNASPTPSPTPAIITQCASATIPNGWVVTAISTTPSCGSARNNTYTIMTAANNLAVCNQFSAIPTGWTVVTSYNSSSCGRDVRGGNTSVIHS